jgi:membrane-associated protease RseP (regulator of RpoE activity)
MLGTEKLSKLLAISALLLIPATVVGFWAVTTNTSFAGDERAPRAYAVSSSGSGAFLGVELEEETEHPAGGARIDRVVEESAAEEAGLEEGDIIVAFDGHTIRGPMALTKRLGDQEPGDTISITVVRDGREQSFDVELGERPGFKMLFHGDDDDLFVAPNLHGLLGCDEDDDDCSFSWTCSGDDCEGVTLGLGSFFGHKPMLGVQLVHVTDELREHLGGEEGTGTLVSKIVSGSPAEDAGIEVGDLIVAVDGEPVEDAGDIREALHGKEGETFDVEVIRDRRRTSIAVTIPEADDEAPSGPRAFHYAPRIELRGHIDHALDSARDALRDSRSAYREALRLAKVKRSGAQRDAREAYREALRMSREAQRESSRKVREAVRKSLERRNSI